jgi:hypothetical protein
MLLVLMMRFIFTKKEKGPDSLLGEGYIWYDQSTSASNFGGYTIFDTDVSWLKYCFNREDTNDRSKIALAPSGNSVIAAIKTQLESDLASYGFSVELYESRDAIMEIIDANNYEKDGVPGI